VASTAVAVIEAENEHPVAQPERAEDAEDGRHRALADGRGPHRSQQQAQGRGRQDDRQGGAEDTDRYHADQP
jgi:hypothetical protein